jgi:2'-hydroxyisoflavone reductase
MNILVIGGTQFIGRDFVESVLKHTNYTVTLANRDQSNKHLFPNNLRIIIDRNNETTCKTLIHYDFDVVVDFSCYTEQQFINTFKNLKYKRYIYISTTGVLVPNIETQPDLNDSYTRYIWNKYSVEKYIKNNVGNCLIIRPCYVYGEHDNSGRFGKRENGTFFWKETNKDVGSESVNVRAITDTIMCNIANESFHCNEINICNQH